MNSAALRGGRKTKIIYTPNLTHHPAFRFSAVLLADVGKDDDTKIDVVVQDRRFDLLQVMSQALRTSNFPPR